MAFGETSLTARDGLAPEPPFRRGVFVFNIFFPGTSPSVGARQSRRPQTERYGPLLLAAAVAAAYQKIINYF